MTRNSAPLQAGALLCFLLADGVAAHPRPPQVIDGVRLVGAVDSIADADAYQVGKRLLADDQVTAALAAFRQAQAASPDSADALNGIGVCYDRLARPDIARQFYEAGLAIDPASPQLLNNLGYSRFLAGDAAAAVVPLRAAAASADPVAAAAAAATLAQLAMPVRSVADPVAEAPPSARIEPTSDGEQRLTFAAAMPAAQLGDAAMLVEATPAWTPGDDAALTAQVAAAGAAEAAAAEAERTAYAVQLAVAATASQAASDPPVVAAAAPVPPATPSDPARLVAALVVNDGDGKAALRRRGAAALRGTIAAIGDGPRQRDPVAFDSDDAELNAFAARVGSDVAIARQALPAEPTRIAAQFRA